MLFQPELNPTKTKKTGREPVVTMWRQGHPQLRWRHSWIYSDLGRDFCLLIILMWTTRFRMEARTQAFRGHAGEIFSFDYTKNSELALSQCHHIRGEVRVCDKGKYVPTASGVQRTMNWKTIAERPSLSLTKCPKGKFWFFKIKGDLIHHSWRWHQKTVRSDLIDTQ